MLSVVAAIAESTSSKRFAKVTVAAGELEAAVAHAEATARDAGLEFFRVATPEGCDVFAMPRGEPDSWRLEIVTDPRAGA